MMSNADSGTANPTIKIRQSRASLKSAACVPGTNHVRRQPTTLATIHNRAAGSGSSTHVRRASGRLSGKTAMAAKIAVNVGPVTESHMSGAALSRSPSAERSPITANMIAITATTASHVSALTLGGRSRRTGTRSVARSRIRRSFTESEFEDVLMALFPRLDSIAKRLQRTMQVDLERARGAPRQGGRVGEQALL